MSEYTVDDVVDYTMSGDHLNLKNALDSILSQKIAGALEDRKAQLGSTMFGPEEGDEPDEDEDSDYADEDESDFDEVDFDDDDFDDGDSDDEE